MLASPLTTKRTAFAEPSEAETVSPLFATKFPTMLYSRTPLPRVPALMVTPFQETLLVKAPPLRLSVPLSGFTVKVAPAAMPQHSVTISMEITVAWSSCTAGSLWGDMGVMTSLNKRSFTDGS